MVIVKINKRNNIYWLSFKSQVSTWENYKIRFKMNFSFLVLFNFIQFLFSIVFLNKYVLWIEIVMDSASILPITKFNIQQRHPINNTFKDLKATIRSFKRLVENINILRMKFNSSKSNGFKIIYFPERILDSSSYEIF